MPGAVGDDVNRDTLHRPHQTRRALLCKHPHVFERVPIPQTGSKPAGRCGHGQSPHSAFGFIYGKGDIVRPKRPTRPDPPHPRPPPVRSWVVAVLSYGMVSMYWCCWLSIASGGCSASPKEETSRNPAIGGAYGLWQAGDPCARSLATSPHGQDTEQQPDSNDSRQHQYMLIIP